MDARCLFIIDVQKGFINAWTEHIPGRVEALQDQVRTVFVTAFVNPQGSMHRRLIGWPRFAPGSEETALAFAPRADAAVIEKSTYTCATPAVVERLRREGIGRVNLCGIATDNCVLKTAVDLFEAGIEPVVLSDACASHGGPACHDCGLRLLRRFIGENQVVESSSAFA